MRFREFRFLSYILVIAIAVTLLVVITWSQGKTPTQLSHDLEREKVAYLRTKLRQRDSAKQIREAIGDLQRLASQKQLKSLDTYRILAEFLDFRPEEEIPHVSTITNLDYFPAMTALLAAGDDAIPALASIPVKEAEVSTMYNNALWTLVYIRDANFREAYATLISAARIATTRKGNQKLKAAAHKIVSFDP